MKHQCGRSVIVRVDISVVIYEATTPQCGRLLVHVLVVRLEIGSVDLQLRNLCWEVSGLDPSFRLDIKVLTYEAITCKRGRSLIHVLVDRTNVEVVTYEAMTPQCLKSVAQALFVQQI